MKPGNKQVELYSTAEDISVNSFEKTLVVAPHQDDESLGCGGTITLLRKNNVAVDVVFVSDGSMSHPNSKKYPAEKLIATREMEALAALNILNVGNEQVHFMRLKDSQVPDSNAIDFNAAVHSFSAILKTVQPSTVLVPWRRDPHKDHRASWQIVNAALALHHSPVRRLEYLIWLWERGEQNEFPEPEEAVIKKVDISSVQQLKQQAIAAHISQTTHLIDDDPQGFILSPEVLAHFNRSYELFVDIK